MSVLGQVRVAPEVRPQGAARRRDAAAAQATVGDIPRSWGVLLLLPFLIATAALVVYPLGELVRASLDPGGLDGWRQYFENPANVRGLRTTFLVAALVTVICMVAGSSLAWMLHTTPRRWLRSLGFALIIMPLWMGAVTAIYSVAILVARHGPINQALTGVGLADRPIDIMFTVGAVIVGMVFQMLPYAALSAYAAFRTVDVELVAVAENLGATRFQAFMGIVVPLALRGLLGTAALVFLISLGFFLTPVILGSATSPFTASLVSQDVFTYFDLTNAAMSALALVVGALAVLALATLLVGRKRLSRAVA